MARLYIGMFFHLFSSCCIQRIKIGQVTGESPISDNDWFIWAPCVLFRENLFCPEKSNRLNNRGWSDFTYGTLGNSTSRPTVISLVHTQQGFPINGKKLASEHHRSVLTSVNTIEAVWLRSRWPVHKWCSSWFLKAGNSSNICEDVEHWCWTSQRHEIHTWTWWLRAWWLVDQYNHTSTCWNTEKCGLAKDWTQGWGWCILFELGSHSVDSERWRSLCKPVLIIQDGCTLDQQKWKL